MATPALYTFAISHYCEIARFALDYHKIAYNLKPLPPGWHAKVLKKLNAKSYEVPLLLVDDTKIQSSLAIIDWAEEHSNNVEFGDLPAECRMRNSAIESRVTSILGVEIRQLYYSEALVNHSDIVPPILQAELSFFHCCVFKLSWKKLRPLMIKFMKLGSEQREQAERIVEGELDWLDALITEESNYFAGQSFTGTDLVVASLLSPLVKPSEHPTYQKLELPPKLQKTLERWGKRPSLVLARKIYNLHR